jgi:hypothetical protein
MYSRWHGHRRAVIDRAEHPPSQFPVPRGDQDARGVSQEVVMSSVPPSLHLATSIISKPHQEEPGESRLNDVEGTDVGLDDSAEPPAKAVLV